MGDLSSGLPYVTCERWAFGSVPAVGRGQDHFSIHMRSRSGKRLSSCAERGKDFVTEGTPVAPKKASEQERPLAILRAHQKIHGSGEPSVCVERGKRFSSKKYIATHQRNHLKNGQRETGSRVNRTSRTNPFQTVQTKEESDMHLKPSEALYGEDKVPVSGTLVQMERNICEYVGSPKTVVNSSWGIQVKEELEITKEWKRTMMEDLESPKEDGPWETAYQENRLTPRIPPVLPLESQTVNKLEVTTASVDHLPDVHKIYVKEEALEGTEHKSVIRPNPTTLAAQRIQIKEEMDTEGEYPLEMQRGGKGSPPPSPLPNHRITAAVALVKSCGAVRREERFTVKKEDQKGDKIFLCPVCGKGFNQKSNLTRHHKIHTTEGTYKCGECGESFRMNRQLLRHQRGHMSEPFKCPECGRSFKQRSNLVRHQRIHTREAPYQCPECEKTFNQKGNLFRHRMIHIRIGPCNCTKCGKFFTQRKNLVRHQKLHMSDGAHRCSTCGKRFRLEKYLRRHQKIHSQKPPYTCKIRGDGFGLGRS